MEEKEKSAISKFSVFFVKNYRITFILFIAILVLGYVSYTKLLVREGFPTVQVPIVIIQANYFVGDIEKVDEDVTKPIEKAISGVKEIKEIQSTTVKNGALITVEFDQDFPTKEGATALNDEIDKSANLPESAEAVSPRDHQQIILSCQWLSIFVTFSCINLCER